MKSLQVPKWPLLAGKQTSADRLAAQPKETDLGSVGLIVNTECLMLKPPIVNTCNTVHFRDLFTPVLDPVLGGNSEQAKCGPSLISCCLSKHLLSSPLGPGEEPGTCLFQWETATRLLFCFLLLLSAL